MSQIYKTAEKLLKAGIAPGDRVAVLSDNSPNYATVVMACWKIGAVAVPISTRYPVSKINSALENLRCAKIFVSADNTKPDLKARTYLIDDFVKSDEPEFTPENFESMNLNLNADASIIFTSASCGRPKAVLHSIANHYYSAVGACKNIPFGKADRWLMSLPMYHISGFSLLMRALLKQGTIVFPASGEPLEEVILNSRLSHLSLVPAQLSGLLNEPACVDALRKLKAILIGGAPIPTALLEEAILEKLPVYTTYGSTEMASQIATTTPQDLKKSKNTCGRILDYQNLKIAPDSEILVKGNTLFTGYVNGDSVELDLDQQGYFHTADTGYIDDGLLFVIGRKDLMFISGGENIFPEEIEKVIENIENVEQAIVVPVDDPLLGQRPVAFVKIQSAQPLDADCIESRLRKNLEGFKIPIAFFPWPKCQEPSLKPNRKALGDYAARNIKDH